jgi:hypothetical protein
LWPYRGRASRFDSFKFIIEAEIRAGRKGRIIRRPNHSGKGKKLQFRHRRETIQIKAPKMRLGFDDKEMNAPVTETVWPKNLDVACNTQKVKTGIFESSSSNFSDRV